MTTLVVLIPARDLNRQPGDWQLGSMAFALFGDAGQELRVGQASLSLLPAARRHILIFAARDVVLLEARVPVLKGPKLRLALPNLIEEQLVSDAARCHVALGPAVGADGMHLLAVVDRAWMRFVLEQFQAEERGGLRGVPLQSCLPAAGAEQVIVTVLGHAGGQDVSSRAPLEVVLQDVQGACGVTLPVSELASSARDFAGERPIILRRVQSAQAQLAVPTGVEAAHFAVQTEIMEFSALARRALTAEFDLCQFEFSAQAWQRNRNNLKRWRVPIGLAAACVIVGLACLNLDWLLLSRERGELQSRANEMLLASFPNTKVVLDAPLQMRRELDAQRSRIGEPEAGDFVVLCDQLARALGPLGPNAVATVDYADHALTVGFAPGVVIDPHWAERLASVGLKAQAAAGKWVVRSAS